MELSVENVRGCPSETVSEGTGSAMHCVLSCVRVRVYVGHGQSQWSCSDGVVDLC